MSLQRLTFADVKASRIPLSLGLCPTDERLLQWCNEGREQLMNRAIGGFWGQTVRVQMCVSDGGCLVWPREAADVVAVAVCKTPIPIYNDLYPFIENVGHVENCDSCSCGCQCGGMALLSDNTTVASALTVLTTGNTIRFYPADEADVGKTVLVQGYDQNLIWVRTTVGGVVIDGEQVTLALPFVDTATRWYRGAPVSIQRQATAYRLLMYEHDVTNGGDRLLASYQPDETRPSYRRSILPGLSGTNCGSTASTSCGGCGTTPLITAIIKLGYVPILTDQDWVYPSNLTALKYVIRSRKRDEENDDAGSEADLQRAIRELRRELDSMAGGRQNVRIHISPTAEFSRVSGGFW